jgi:16S rRNA (cytidine1402-2'-O)-methyltransferase
MAKLVLVPTPIGNLEDITLRAQRILQTADFVLAEDTRTTGNLFRLLGITAKVQAYHKFNEHKMLASLVDRIQAASLVALVSDAGTPGISDPGFLLIRACVEQGIETECLPGATAFVPALVNSGLPCDRFYFEGFLPAKKGRKTRLELLKEQEATMVFYESPYRVVRTLKDFGEVFGAERRVSVSREITKKFEETVRGTITELLAHFAQKEPKGEFVMVVEGKAKTGKMHSEDDESE